MRQAIGLLSLSALLSCSNGLDPSNGLGPSNDLAGTWASNFTIPGSSIDLNLEQTDRNITGTPDLSPSKLVVPARSPSPAATTVHASRWSCITTSV